MAGSTCLVKIISSYKYTLLTLVLIFQTMHINYCSPCSLHRLFNQATCPTCTDSIFIFQAMHSRHKKKNSFTNTGRVDIIMHSNTYYSVRRPPHR